MTRAQYHYEASRYRRPRHAHPCLGLLRSIAIARAGLHTCVCTVYLIIVIRYNIYNGIAVYIYTHYNYNYILYQLYIYYNYILYQLYIIIIIIIYIYTYVVAVYMYIYIHIYDVHEALRHPAMCQPPAVRSRWKPRRGSS